MIIETTGIEFKTQPTIQRISKKEQFLRMKENDLKKKPTKWAKAIANSTHEKLTKA